MTQEELNFIKDSFSQIINDIAGNPNWYDAAKAIASDLGTLERQLEKNVIDLPSNLDEAADSFAQEHFRREYFQVPRDGMRAAFKAGAEWMSDQFQKIEVGELVDWYSTSDGKEYCCGVKTNDAFEVPEGFYIKKK